MKKFYIVVTICLLLIITGMIVLRNNYEKKEEASVKVGVVMNGTIDDQSWSQAHYEGMEATKDKLNVEVVYCEAVPQDEQCISVMEELISEGCEIIVCNSFGFGEYALEVAENNPDICFYHATGTEISDNLSTYFGRMYQMRYLTGVIAGLQTETNEIGYVAAYPISEVNRGINAFTLGVQSVNPDATVYVAWCNSWTGDDESREAAESLLEGHNIDILTMHTDSLAPLDVADENGIWSIGYNYDNSENYPDSFLTAAVWDWEKFYTPRIQEYILGTFASKNYWETADTGMIALAPFTQNVKPGIEEIVLQEKEKMESGRFDVFYGPITDTDGNLRVLEGENMSDTEILNEFTWYIKGVVIDE